MLTVNYPESQTVKIKYIMYIIHCTWGVGMLHTTCDELKHVEKLSGLKFDTTEQMAYLSKSNLLSVRPLCTDLPTPITCKSGGFEKQALKNLEIRTSNLET